MPEAEEFITGFSASVHLPPLHASETIHIILAIIPFAFIIGLILSVANLRRKSSFAESLFMVIFSLPFNGAVSVTKRMGKMAEKMFVERKIKARKVWK